MSSRLSTPIDALENSYLEQLQNQFGTLIEPTADLGGETLTLPETNVRPSPKAEGDGLEEYEFRLFSEPSKGENATSLGNGPQRIAIKSPPPINGNPEFVVPRRPNDYYFTGPLDATHSEELRAVAVSGEDIMRGLKVRWVCIFPVLWLALADLCIARMRTSLASHRSQIG